MKSNLKWSDKGLKIVRTENPTTLEKQYKKVDFCTNLCYIEITNKVKFLALPSRFLDTENPNQKELLVVDVRKVTGSSPVPSTIKDASATADASFCFSVFTKPLLGAIMELTK